MTPLKPGNIDSLPGVLVENWFSSAAEEEAAWDALNRAKTKRLNAAIDLAKSMRPDDAANGERITFWHGKDLVQITYWDSADPEINIRQRKK